jgi:hypothetical protein
LFIHFQMNRQQKFSRPRKTWVVGLFWDRVSSFLVSRQKLSMVALCIALTWHADFGSHVCGCRIDEHSTSNMNAAAKTNEDDGYFSWLWPSSSSVFAL